MSAEAHLHATGTAADALSVREKPILFSGEMVGAILDGRKTMTRRVALKNPEYKEHYEFSGFRTNGRASFRLARPHKGLPLLMPSFGVNCPYGAPGDRLWVRETWKVSANRNDDPPSELRGEMSYGGVRYIADGDTDLKGKRRPSIHMPRWASRITLEITGVRVERLTEISFEDCRAEGCSPDFKCPAGDCRDATCTGTHYGEKWHFQNLWDSMAKPGFAWKDSPWVWCIAFRRIT